MSIYCIENTHVTKFSGNTILFYTRIDNFYKFFYSWWPWDRIWYGKTWLPLIDVTMNTVGLGFRCLRLKFYNAWFYYLWKNNKKNGGTDRCFYKYRLILSQTWISSRQISFNLKKENNIRDWWLISRVWRAHWRPDVLVEEQHQSRVVRKTLEVLLVIQLSPVLLQHQIDLLAPLIPELLHCFLSEVLQTSCHDSFSDLSQSVGNFVRSFNWFL